VVIFTGGCSSGIPGIVGKAVKQLKEGHTKSSEIEENIDLHCVGICPWNSIQKHNIPETDAGKIFTDCKRNDTPQ
jgi:hypothetical protein